MAIRITFKFESVAKKGSEMAKFHDALTGSPAYKDNEIAICDEPETNIFHLIVGNDNDNDKDYNIAINMS